MAATVRICMVRYVHACGRVCSSPVRSSFKGLPGFLEMPFAAIVLEFTPGERTFQSSLEKL